MNTHLPAAAGIHLRRSWVSLAVGTLLALGSGAASAVDTTFTGFTNGCFGLNCVPAPNSATTSVTFGGLTYTNSTFSVTSASGGAAIGAAPGTPNVDNLGSFTLSGLPFDYNGGHFDMLVTFSAPPGTTPGSTLIQDTLSLVVNGTDNGGVFIDFGNVVKHFTFGSGATAGSFDFIPNNVSLTAGHSVSATGRILVIAPQVTTVPEPESYALLLAGLGAVGFMARRRRS